MYYNHYKLNEIYASTWPNINWTKKNITPGCFVKFNGGSLKDKTNNKCPQLDTGGIYCVEKIAINNGITTLQLKNICGEFDLKYFKII